MLNATATVVTRFLSLGVFVFFGYFFVLTGLPHTDLVSQKKAIRSFFMGLIMSLKKSLKRHREGIPETPAFVFNSAGQSVLEYFILLAIIASLTILATSSLYRRTQYDVEEFTNAAAAAMAPDPG